MIFDDATRVKGAIKLTNSGVAMDHYQWSHDNSEEFRKGWIKAGDSIPALADQMHLPSDTLQSTIEHYNSSCKAGYDAELGRSASTLLPIVQPPFYAIELWPAIINTQGGPKEKLASAGSKCVGTPHPPLIQCRRTRLALAPQLSRRWECE